MNMLDDVQVLQLLWETNRARDPIYCWVRLDDKGDPIWSTVSFAKKRPTGFHEAAIEI